MHDRSEQILRITCIVLAVLVLVQLFRAGCHVGALVGAKIPPVPTLETNSVSATNAMAATKGSNAPLVKTVTTNSSNPAATGTNTAPDKMTSAVSTNQVSVRTNPPAIIGATNSPKKFAGETPAAEINKTVPAKMEKAVSTNAEAGTIAGTNLSATTLPNSTNHVSATTNPPANISLSVGTNAIPGGTNLISVTSAVQSGTNGLPADTNSVAGAKSPKKSKKNSSPDMTMTGDMAAGGFPGMPGKAPKLEPEIQARVDKIVDSEMFAPVMRPLPMALLGIAGDTAFLRTASGQTGLVKEGDALGEIKLLRIGVNRVLIEQDGQKKELMIFDGYGGESLLPKPNESSK